MKPIFIFGSGERDSISFYLPFLAEKNNIIAIDGGADLLHELNILPDWVIGDFDSITKEADQWLFDHSVIRYSFPSNKAASDFELASQKIIQMYSPTEIGLFCMLGKRSDHFLFNLIVCEQLLNHGFNSVFYSQMETIYFIDSEHPLCTKGIAGDIVSVQPCRETVMIQNTKGLKYSLQEEELHRLSSRGLSNEMVDNQFEISIGKGQAIVIHTRKTL